MYTRYEHLRYIIYLIEIYILHSLDQTPGLLPEIFGARPLLVIPALVCICLFEKKFISIAFGILVGLLFDINSSSFLGFNAVILGICGCILELMCTYFMKTNFFSSIIFTGIFSLIIMSTNFCFHYDTMSYNFVWDFWYWPIVISTMISALPIYFLHRTISGRIRERKNETHKY